VYLFPVAGRSRQSFDLNLIAPGMNHLHATQDTVSLLVGLGLTPPQRSIELSRVKKSKIVRQLFRMPGNSGVSVPIASRPPLGMA
jgi:hypothetical protein